MTRFKNIYLLWLLPIAAIGVLCYKFDWEILYFIQSYLRAPALDLFFSKITLLGELAICWFVWGIVLLFFRKYRKVGLLVIIGVLIGALVGNLILKNAVARPRPSWIDTSVALLISNLDDFSFPSGHTLSSTIAATILALSNKKFAYCAIPLAVIMAFSRLYLFVHFPTDIYAGAVIGLVIGFGTYLVAGWIIEKKFGAKL